MKMERGAIGEEEGKKEGENGRFGSLEVEFRES